MLEVAWWRRGISPARRDRSTPTCALRTPLCRALGIEYPIFSAGMGTGAGPDLAAAVSNAGGFGVIGASAFLPDAIPGLIDQVRDRTTRPFGVNIIIDIDEPDFTDD